MVSLYHLLNLLYPHVKISTKLDEFRFLDDSEDVSFFRIPKSMAKVVNDTDIGVAVPFENRGGKE